MPMPRNLHYNPVAQRWESKGRDELVKAHIGESGLGANDLTIGTLATIQNIIVGSGSRQTFILGFTGTNAAITSIGTGAIAQGTITNATGIAVGDKVFGVPKADRSAGHVGFAGFHVPTTNTLNVWVQNSKPDSAGSFPATGWDIITFRTV